MLREHEQLRPWLWHRRQPRAWDLPLGHARQTHPLLLSSQSPFINCSWAPCATKPTLGKQGRERWEGIKTGAKVGRNKGKRRQATNAVTILIPLLLAVNLNRGWGLWAAGSTRVQVHFLSSKPRRQRAMFYIYYIYIYILHI